MTVCRGIRGATVADDNTREAIVGAVEELMSALIEGNELVETDAAAVFFTMTPDLNAAFPAGAARRMGWHNTALLGSVETEVPGSLNRCIRILILVNTDKDAGELVNVYLRGTDILRS